MARPSDAKLAELTERRVRVSHCATVLPFHICSHALRIASQRKKQQHRALRVLNSREYRARKQLVKRRERLGRAVAQLLPATNGGAPSGKELIDNSACHSLKVKCIPNMRGVGVFAEAGFKPGQVLVRYAGETVTLEEGNVREAARRTDLSAMGSCVFAQK